MRRPTKLLLRTGRDLRQLDRGALHREGAHLDLGGIGKGYAVDRGVAILRRRGLSDFMVQAGVDLCQR